MTTQNYDDGVDDYGDDGGGGGGVGGGDDDDGISYRLPLAVECSCAPNFAATLPQKYLTRSTFYAIFTFVNFAILFLFFIRPSCRKT